MTTRKGFGKTYQDLLDLLLEGVPGELRLLTLGDVMALRTAEAARRRSASASGAVRPV